MTDADQKPALPERGWPFAGTRCCVAALRLIAAMQSRSVSIPAEYSVFPNGVGNVAIFLPNRTIFRIPIFLLHGLHPAGHRDRRIVSLGAALAHAGAVTIAPQLESFANLDLLSIGPLDLTKRLAEIRDTLFPKRPSIAIVAPSFAASLSLVAANIESPRIDISGVLSVGAFFDILETLKFAIDSPTADKYGKLVASLNMAQVVNSSAVTHLRQEVRSYLRDWGIGIDDESELPRDGPPTSETAVDISERLHNLTPSQRARLVALSPHHIVPTGRARTLLLHGESDTVIPPNHSVRMANHLAQNGVPVRLRVTRLLDHSAVKPRLNDIIAVLKLWRDLQWWLRCLC